MEKNSHYNRRQMSATWECDERKWTESSAGKTFISSKQSTLTNCSFGRGTTWFSHIWALNLWKSFTRISKSAPKPNPSLTTRGSSRLLRTIWSERKKVHYSRTEISVHWQFLLLFFKRLFPQNGVAGMNFQVSKSDLNFILAWGFVMG